MNTGLVRFCKALSDKTMAHQNLTNLAWDGVSPGIGLSMSDIKRPEAVTMLRERPDGRSPGDDGKGAGEQLPKKVVETYEESARSLPVDDSITILGIPIERINSAAHAALAALVSENNYLRNALSRYEGGSHLNDSQKGPGSIEETALQASILDYNSFVEALGEKIALSPGDNGTWVLILVHLKTYEILNRSSGLLAANGALEDISHRFSQIGIEDISQKIHRLDESANSISMPLVNGNHASLDGDEPVTAPLTLLGYAGGASVAGLIAVSSSSLDTTFIARKVRDHICDSGFHVGGVDMALQVQVAAAACGVGESPLLALGRVDHLMRAG
ncbi:MAG: hypothetical protein CMG46_12605 [Candidatus Marinimicrobia bacterium]|nr:hypothetical protein [Candidatus Neomarinimicrobiota bacterium]